MICGGVLLVFSILFGGASREHVLRLALVELAALPVLVLALNRLFESRQWKSHALLLALLATLPALVLLQLAPLPPGIWTNLPGREQAVLGLEITGVTAGWAPISLTPDLTWASFLALLPPAAAVLACLTAPADMRRRAIGLYLILALASICLGIAQWASRSEVLYLYRTTDAGNIVGFFSNRNHLATLLLMLLPFAAAFLGQAVKVGDRSPRLWGLACLIGLMIVSLAVIRSRAGVILALPALTGSFAIGVAAAGRFRLDRKVLAAGLAAVLAVGVIASLGLPRIQDRFGVSLVEGRADAWRVAAGAAAAFLPIGSGVGSFDTVYRSVEPLEDLDSTFLNHAHNEYLETWLETGWFGIIWLGAFLFWWGRRSLAAWRTSPGTPRTMPRAASVALLILLLHSAGDYPVRTETIAVLAAVCVAILEFAGRKAGQSRRAAAVA